MTASTRIDPPEAVRAGTRQLWPRLTVARLLTVEKDPFYGGPQPHFGRLLYGLENEIHHRAQGFVYLRVLRIEPPFFGERYPLAGGRQNPTGHPVGFIAKVETATNDLRADVAAHCLKLVPARSRR